VRDIHEKASRIYLERLGIKTDTTSSFTPRTSISMTTNGFCWMERNHWVEGQQDGNDDDTDDENERRLTVKSVGDGLLEDTTKAYSRVSSIHKMGLHSDSRAS
jgi:hypothetical protein